ncbi:MULTISPECIES: TetR/AcrR family transcriptional regulator [Nonomuraea]|uniref:TetR/AcrR family transcriptional regulator, transcriptional repressor for nem operon n=2 Tax=Nonomuraea TaxID=83681 RepID=A0A1H6F2P7_9ACTN|nr:TetR/AcrR family transcriptional regulator [Nonomuraea solani]SEH03883.1 TetR/AcrR family transcriptional regulator, transcriptional repressor for nem operon [Nonomuraea solani]
MGRVSRAQALENRKRIVESASRLFREQGTQVSVADLMKAVGLTHGGFYKQFASKQALIDEATTHAFDERTQRHRAALERHAGQLEAQRALIDAYLSVEHRDDPGGGCPVAGLASDMAREPGNDEAHRVYTEGVGDLADWLATDDQDGLTRLCTMLGALLLARATKDSPLSEEILTAARAALTTTARSGT